MIRAVRGLGGKASQPLSENKSALFSLPEVFPLSLFLQPFPLPNYNPKLFYSILVILSCVNILSSPDPMWLPSPSPELTVSVKHQC